MTQTPNILVVAQAQLNNDHSKDPHLVPAALVGDTGIEIIACCHVLWQYCKETRQNGYSEHMYGVVHNALIDLMLETHQVRNGAFELPGLDPDPIRALRDVSVGGQQLTDAS